jgi:hypothetical protein
MWRERKWFQRGRKSGRRGAGIGGEAVLSWSAAIGRSASWVLYLV